ncbi:MAG: hypothetical protein KGM99_20815, partial [Burkholderiales bacterium]|nr:hypothetical protein [Burkholderiales bacterium]
TVTAAYQGSGKTIPAMSWLCVAHIVLPPLPDIAATVLPGPEKVPSQSRQPASRHVYCKPGAMCAIRVSLLKKTEPGQQQTRRNIAARF